MGLRKKKKLNRQCIHLGNLKVLKLQDGVPEREPVFPRFTGGSARLAQSIAVLADWVLQQALKVIDVIRVVLI